MMRLWIALVLLLAGCAPAGPTLIFEGVVDSTTYPMFDTEAERALWKNGCEDRCGDPDEITNGLECYYEGRITYCRPLP